MPSPVYGQMSPQMNDPYNIETTLAQGMMDPQKSAVSTALLNLYRSDRQLQGNIAGRDLAQQHDFAERGLQAQIAKNMTDAINEGAKSDTLEMLITNPQTKNMFANADLGAIQRRHEQGGRAATAKLVNDLASGAYHSVQAGRPLSSQTLTNLSGVDWGNATPLSTINAQIGAASGSGGDGTRESTTLVDDRTMQQYTISGKNSAAVDARVAARQAKIDAGGAPGGGSSAPPTRGANSVNPPQPGTIRAVPQTTINAVNDHMHVMAKRGDPIALDVIAGSAGGTPKVQIRGTGVYAQGKSGVWRKVGETQ